MRLGFAALAATAVVGLVPGTANAGPIVFNQTTLVGFQQTDNRPCVIGDSSCNKPAGWNNFLVSGTPGLPNNPPSVYDLFSPTYLVIPGTGINNVAGEDQIPAQFDILIDQNIAGGFGNENLIFFKTFDCGTSTTIANGGNVTKGDTLPICALDAANSFTGPQSIPNNNNGNGFSDAGLSGFSLIVGHHYFFEVSITNDSDGMEEYFILPTTEENFPRVPEPGSMILLGSGLIGIASRLRKRA